MLTTPNQQSSADKEVLKQLGSDWQLKKKLMDWLDQNDWIEYKFNAVTLFTGQIITHIKYHSTSTVTGLQK